jgi:hypothetical protein
MGVEARVRWIVASLGMCVLLSAASCSHQERQVLLSKSNEADILLFLCPHGVAGAPDVSIALADDPEVTIWRIEPVGGLRRWPSTDSMPWTVGGTPPGYRTTDPVAKPLDPSTLYRLSVSSGEAFGSFSTFRPSELDPEAMIDGEGTTYKRSTFPGSCQRESDRGVPGWVIAVLAPGRSS